MKVDVSQHVLDYEGKPLMRTRTHLDGSPVLGEDGRAQQEPEVLRNFIVLALNNTAEQEREVFTPEQKGKIYELTTKIYQRKNVDFTADDVVFIKERVGKIYGALIFGRVTDILENREREISVEEDEAVDLVPSPSKKEKVAAKS